MTRSDRFEGAVLVAIVLLVGTAAGAASFSHVHDWTMTNSPAGTPGWFGWANACISELVPIASLLELRRRRRRHADAKVGYPLSLLIGAALLSLSAQLAVAKPGLSGWLLSAVPAVAFMALVKLVLAPKPKAPAEVPQAPSVAPGRPLATGGLVAAAEPVLVGEFPPVKRTPAYPPTRPAPEPAPAHQAVKAAFADEQADRTPEPAADDTLEQPGMADAVRNATTRPPRGRPLADTRRLIDAVLAQEPGLSQQKLADRLDVSRRTVRDALALDAA